jgi:ribosome modulation factor
MPGTCMHRARARNPGAVQGRGNPSARVNREEAPAQHLWQRGYWCGGRRLAMISSGPRSCSDGVSTRSTGRGPTHRQDTTVHAIPPIAADMLAAWIRGSAPTRCCLEQFAEPCFLFCTAWSPQ